MPENGKEKCREELRVALKGRKIEWENDRTEMEINKTNKQERNPYKSQRAE